jgi:DNA segregation ATPase FtsK/SpoIIIE, S-DNA-T family
MPFFLSARNQPLPEKLVALLEDLRSVALGLIALYLAVVLMGYRQEDHGWSHISHTAQVINPGGAFGAWLADVLLYLFGFSAWWFVLAMLYGIVSSVLHPRDGPPMPHTRHSLFVMLIGFFMILCAASGMEALRFYSSTFHLPFFAGGILGYEVGGLVVAIAGYTGGTLVLLALLLMGCSLFFGISLLGFVEDVGLWFETLWAHFSGLGRTSARGGRESAQEALHSATRALHIPKGSAKLARQRIEPAIQQARRPNRPPASNTAAPLPKKTSGAHTRPPASSHGTVARPPRA